MFFNGNTVKLMKKIVPEFLSNNSEFCKLDNKEISSENNTVDSHLDNKGEKKIFQS